MLIQAIPLPLGRNDHRLLLAQLRNRLVRQLQVRLHQLGGREREPLCRWNEVSSGAPPRSQCGTHLAQADVLEHIYTVGGIA